MPSIKRMEGEAFEVFRERRRVANNQAKSDAYNRLVKIFRPTKKTVVRKAPKFFTCPAVGKKHKNETPAAFRIRRKNANARRREREKARKHALTPKPEFVGTLQDVMEA